MIGRLRLRARRITPPHGVHHIATSRAQLITTHMAKFERRLMALLLCAPLLGLLGVVAAEAVPDRRIADHLVDGQQSGVFTGHPGQGTTPLGMPTRMQVYVECRAFSVGLGDQPDWNRV